MQAFETWVDWEHGLGSKYVLRPKFEDDAGDPRITESDWEQVDHGTITPPSFTVPLQDVADLSIEVSRYNPIKPIRTGQDTEQIEWLRKLIERSMFPPQAPYPLVPPFPPSMVEPTNDA